MVWIRKTRVLSLDEVLQYRNERVVLSFLRNSALSRVQAEQLFLEVLKWLWLCRIHDHESTRELNGAIPNHLAIYPPMKLLDEMWHTFILCTRDYEDFCRRFMGGFIHHEPAVDEAGDGPGAEELESREREALVRYISSRLGSDTLKRWFEEIPEWQSQATT